MKKTFTMLILICFSLCCVNAAEYENFDKRESVINQVINEIGVTDNNSITRAECLIILMNIIGAPKEEVEKWDGADFFPFADVEPFSYFGGAYCADIAYGEACIIDYETIFTSHTGNNYDYFFFPERAVTLEECLAFMVRCLEEEQDEEGYVKRIGLEEAVIKAKQYGIITEKDSFASDVKANVNLQTLEILLTRFIQQKRFKYFGIADYEPFTGWFLMSGLQDENRSITYLEMWCHPSPLSSERSYI